MPIPLIIKGALIAKAAHSGAKAGAKEALEETAAANKPEQPLSPPALTATSAYHMQASVSISTQKKEAIDLLLKVQRYLVLVKLRDRITKDRINVDFYSLFLQKQGLIEFLQQHPRIAHLFLDQVQNCIGSFFEDLDRVISSPKEPTLVPRQVNRPGADLSEADKKARRLRYKLLNIESCPHSEKMRLLQERDSDDQNSIGHLCLGLNYELRRRYADILQSLEPNALFIILKLSNRQKASIYSLYYASGLDLCALISNCQDDPNVFCDILEHFTIDIQTIQSLVNIYGLKEKIRTYLLSLPDQPENWRLLARCLDQSTTIGKFCAKEANRIHHIFQSGGERVTVTMIRTKVESHHVPAVCAVVEDASPLVITPKILTAYTIPLSNTMSISHESNDTCKQQSYPLASPSAPPISEQMLQDENSSIHTSSLVVPSPIHSDFLIYIGLATVITAALVALIYPYLNASHEDPSTFRLS